MRNRRGSGCAPRIQMSAWSFTAIFPSAWPAAAPGPLPQAECKLIPNAKIRVAGQSERGVTDLGILENQGSDTRRACWRTPGCGSCKARTNNDDSEPAQAIECSQGLGELPVGTLYEPASKAPGPRHGRPARRSGDVRCRGWFHWADQGRRRGRASPVCRLADTRGGRLAGNRR